MKHFSLLILKSITLWLVILFAAISALICMYVFEVRELLITIGFLVICPIGILMGLRGVFRVGVKQWIKSQNILSGGKFKPTPEDIENQRQNDLDKYFTLLGSFYLLIGAVGAVISQLIL